MKIGMRTSLFLTVATVAMVVSLVATRKSTASDTTAALVSQGAGTAPVAPIQERPHPLKGVAAIVEFDIVSTTYTYDDIMGPRANFALANVVVHAGSVSKLTTLSHFGGPLPNGNMAVGSELPVLTPGSRYIAFLGSAPWFYTPVWTYLSFRVEKVGSRSIVVGPNGRPVTSFSADGVTFAKTQVVDLSEPNDPTVARPRASNVSEADPEIASALDHDSFVSAAIKASNDVGAQFTAAVPTAPSLLGGSPKWNVVYGTPAGAQ